MGLLKKNYKDFKDKVISDWDWGFYNCLSNKAQAESSHEPQNRAGNLWVEVQGEKAKSKLIFVNIYSLDSVTLWPLLVSICV